MFLRYSILAVIGLFIYFAFFCSSKKVFRGYGTCRERIDSYTFGNKSSKIKENALSEFLSKENIENPETWALTSACRFGFFNIDTLNENYRVNRESYIEKLEICLTQKLIEKKDDIKYKEEVLKPNLKIFLNSLNKRNLEELEKIMTRLEEE